MQIDLFLSFVINSITFFTKGFSLNAPFNLLMFSVRFFVAKISLYASLKPRISLLSNFALLSPIKLSPFNIFLFPVYSP